MFARISVSNPQRLKWIVLAFCLLVSAKMLAANGDVRVDDGTSSVKQYPDVAVDTEGNIYVVWHDDREGMWDWSVYFAKSTDGGKTFGRNVKGGERLSFMGISSINCSR